MRIKIPILKNAFELLKDSFTAFSEDNAMKMSAALAYYTIFSLAPLLLIVIWLTGFFFGEQATKGEVFSQIDEFVGEAAAKQIQEFIQGISLAGKSGLAITIGAGTLIAGATKVFIEIQDSINAIWGVRAKPKKGWVKLIVDRVLSFSVIIGLGFLLIVSLSINIVIDTLSNTLVEYFPNTTVFFISLINGSISFIIIAILFAVIFKFLPDAEVKWTYVRTGAIFTTVLFIIGKYLIGLYMQYTAPASAYGAAGSVIIILLWIYYTATILFFGAEFTQVYAKRRAGEIRPSKYAVRIIVSEIEQDVNAEPQPEASLPELK
jgi:membrane protein